MTTVKAINPLALLCIGDVIASLMLVKFAILTLGYISDIFQFTNKTFFKAKAAKTAL